MLKKHGFLFEELVKRDFKKKYKRTVLGMGWSLLSPLLMLLVMKVVFGQFFGGAIEHYTTYLFCGNLLFMYFSESTNEGMACLRHNAAIFTKVNVPKYIFLLAKNVQTLLNFALTLAVFFVFCLLDGVDFSWRFLLLAYPVATFTMFNLGMGLILSALFVFFTDMQYLWRVVLQLVMYGSAIFYSVDVLPPGVKMVLGLNPVYVHISYFREIVLNGAVPSPAHHFVLMAFAVVSLAVGCWMYRRYNTEFLYYV
jgi:ABC-2 type transport system permease protein